MRELVFVVARGRERAGSAEMRGRQLAEAVAAAAPGRPVRLALHDEEIRGAVVVLNKTAMLPPFRGTLARLRAAGCAVLADFVDIPVAPDLARQADGFLAASILQARHLREAHAGKPVIELPHQCDAAIGALRCQWDGFAAGYVGQPHTAMHVEALAASGRLALVRPLPRNRNGWVAALPRLNLHYAVRPRSLWDGGFKPFTKGVTAARLGAPVLVDASDEEALEQLGRDYPFVAPTGASADALAALLDRLRDGFGDAAWRLARARMDALAARMSDAAHAEMICERLLAHPLLR